MQLTPCPLGGNRYPGPAFFTGHKENAEPHVNNATLSSQQPKTLFHLLKRPSPTTPVYGKWIVDHDTIISIIDIIVSNHTSLDRLPLILVDKPVALSFHLYDVTSYNS